MRSGLVIGLALFRDGPGGRRRTEDAQVGQDDSA